MKLTSLILLATLPLAAQTHRVAAKGPVTRAVAVYEWTGDIARPTAARLVPVTVFIDGAFQDGGTYLARPIPLALLNENVYSLENAGAPQGTLTLLYARHLQTANAGAGENITDLGWFGYGTFQAPAAEKPAAPLRNTTVHGINASKDSDSTASKDVDKDDDDRPTFSKKPTGKSGSKSDDKSSVTPVTTPDDDPDRPHLSKNPAASTTPTTAPGDVDGAPQTSKPSTTTSTTTKPEDDDPNDRPTLRHRDPKQAEADRKARARSSVNAAGTGPDDDPDRPRIRRGLATSNAAAPPQLSGLPPGMHQLIAISDPATRAAHVFHRDWESPQEQTGIEGRLTAIAQTKITAYRQGNAAPLPAPSPRASHTSRAVRRLEAQPATTPLADITTSGFQLEYSGLPTFVFTAHTATPTDPGGPPALFVTVVAQRLPTGELQTAFSSVTDAGHLDRTPQYILIDAVDPDATNRASLLFELRAQTARQFALLRLTGAEANQIFLTNPTE